MKVTISRDDFLSDRQGRTFSDVANDAEVHIEAVLDFFSNESRQRRMEESEIHHDRPSLAGVVRELEALPAIDKFLATSPPNRTKRLRQAIGVTVRMVMEKLGWAKTGKKGSLGVRIPAAGSGKATKARHNTGGLAFWFLRAERYTRPEGMPYVSVRERVQRRGRTGAQSKLR
jgi:hypothetical protein